MKRKNDRKKWDYVIHHRIANYFKLYSQVLNFQKFMLVSHGDMISVYDMTLDMPEDTIQTDIIQRAETTRRQFAPDFDKTAH